MKRIVHFHLVIAVGRPVARERRPRLAITQMLHPHLVLVVVEAVQPVLVAAAAAAAARPQRQDLLEGQAEVRVEDGVDDRVEGAVRVAQPCQKLEYDRRDARLAERSDDVHAKEWHPADEEHAHDDAERDGRFVIGHVIVVVGRRRMAALALRRGSRQPQADVHRGIARRRRAVGVRLEAAEQDDGPRDGLDVLHVLLGVEKEPRVNGQHHEARQVEADARGHDRVRGRQVQCALRLVHCGVLDERAVRKKRLQTLRDKILSLVPRRLGAAAAGIDAEPGVP